MIASAEGPHVSGNLAGVKVVDGCADREERRRESIAEQVQAAVRASGPGQQYDSVVVVGDAGVSRACLVARLAGHKAESFPIAEAPMHTDAHDCIWMIALCEVGFA